MFVYVSVSLLIIFVRYLVVAGEEPHQRFNRNNISNNTEFEIIFLNNSIGLPLDYGKNNMYIYTHVQQILQKAENEFVELRNHFMHLRDSGRGLNLNNEDLLQFETKMKLTKQNLEKDLKRILTTSGNRLARKHFFRKKFPIIISVLKILSNIFTPTTSSTIEPATKEPPAKEPSTKEPSTKEPPTKEPPTKEPPTKEPPTKEPPTKEPPTKEPPTKEPPTKEPPTKEPPIEEPSTKEPPTKEPPTKEPPTKEPPTKEPPTKEPPTKEPPTKEPPTKEPPIEEPSTKQKRANERNIKKHKTNSLSLNYVT